MIFEYLRREVQIENKLCFVIMSFGADTDNIFEYGIRPAVEGLGMRCIRADDNISSIPIMFQIFDEILRARVIIADLTNKKPNVYYELGLCHALKQHVILLKRDGEDVPFDLQGIRHIVYVNEMGGERKLRELLECALKEIDNEPSVPVRTQEAEKLLQKARRVWQESEVIILKFEEFLEIVLDLNQRTPVGEDLAFLAYLAAYFGKFMKRLCEYSRSEPKAIATLVSEAARGSTLRVPWRAAIMLEHYDVSLVADAVKAYQGSIANRHIFPDAVTDRQTLFLLQKEIESESISKVSKDKLSEVLKQVTSEFGVKD